MAKLQFFALFLIFFLLLASPEMGVVEGKLCERRSQTWTGVCVKTGNCNNQCKRREGASSGACHFEFPGFACFCYFNC